MGEQDWYGTFAKWLEPRGLYPVNVQRGEWRPPGVHILSAGSPRGDFSHSVLAQGDLVIHDPHPSREGLVRLVTAEVTLLVPFWS